MSPLLHPLAAAVLLAAPRAEDLSTLAAASPRPPECGGWPSSAERRTVWDDVSLSARAKRCDALARGNSLLERDPKRALAIAESLLRKREGDGPALTLSARALARLGRSKQALSRFERSRGIDPASVEVPGAVRDLATVALETGHLDIARQALGALLPRVSLLGDPVDAVRVRVEAALVAMLGGPEGLDEAIAYLSSARETISAPELDEIVIVALALAFDRAGQPARARDLLEEASGPWRLEALVDPDEPASHSVHLPVMPMGEAHAMIALLAEPVDRELARIHWEAFIEARGERAFSDHAKERLGRLRGGP